MLAVRPVRHVIYLHGFASSPASSKARRFAQELAALGVECTCPDLNQPSFETLTVTRMLDVTARAITSVGDGPIALVGSSLGGFLAVHAADRDRTGSVDRLVLLAPAFDFGGNRLRQLGDRGIDAWRRTGRLEVFHYGDNAIRSVGFALCEDAAQYDAFALPAGPAALVFQGRQDDTVPAESVVRWASTRPNVDLRLVNDGHQLATSMDEIWLASKAFLGLDATQLP
ncbi:MAG: alpha/beta fold hydrolase [Acidobacteria bacterium]|nr:alpha/beta fold hydrolase [Acidobacteriota bacterium]